MKKDVLAEVKKQAAKVLKVETVACVMEKYGAADYWRDFSENFENDRNAIGDGSVYFRTMMRKLSKAATKTAAPVAEPVLEKMPPKKACVQIALSRAIPASYMPNPFAPIKEGALVAVHLSDARCTELGLTGFTHFGSDCQSGAGAGPGDLRVCLVGIATSKKKRWRGQERHDGWVPGSVERVDPGQR